MNRPDGPTPDRGPQQAARGRRVPGLHGLRGLTVAAAATAALAVAAVAAAGSSGTVPDDPQFGQQWALYNTGQEVGGTTGTAGADISAPQAWDVTVGTRDVVVAVVDTGISSTHEDLQANMWRNPGGVNGCPEGTTGYNALMDDCNPESDGHGTSVAGVVGAVGNNDAGVAGVAWHARLMNLSVAAPVINTTVLADYDTVIEAIDWAIRARRDHSVNVRVINMSFGFKSESADLHAKIEEAGDAGILAVTSAGNNADNVDDVAEHPYPCTYTAWNLICVAATDQDDTLTTWSNWGPQSVDLAAPGSNIRMTDTGDRYTTESGTSFAAPHVAGVAALLWSHQPDLTVAEVRDRILDSVDPLESLDGKVATGGRLNAYRALTSPSESPSPSESDSESPSPSPSESDSESPSPSESESESPSPSESESESPSPSESESPSPSESPSGTESESPSESPSGTESESESGVVSVSRLAGGDRVETSLLVSQDGWTGSEHVVVATGWGFADALAGGGLAAALDAPLLLSPPDRLPGAVEGDLDRLGAGTVWLLGGQAALSGDIEQRLDRAGYTVHRIAGPDRFATAATIADHLGAPDGRVMLALGAANPGRDAWPDALAAGTLTATPGPAAPVLLTGPDRLPEATVETLQRIGVQHVDVLGGPAAISDAVVDRLQASGYTVRRLAGADRYATSAAAADAALDGHPDGGLPLVVATGTGYPDGLTATALAARTGAVLLLVPPDDLTHADATVGFLDQHGHRLHDRHILGGTTAISEQVADQLNKR